MSGSDSIGGIRKALVIRYGAIGDAVMITPVLRLLKQEGYHVTLNCSEYSRDVYNNNPNVDVFMVHKTGSVPNTQLDEYWKMLSQYFHKVINLSQSIEGDLLKVPWQPEYKLSKDELHVLCDKNYYDHTCEVAGYPEVKGESGELFFSREEEQWAQTQMSRMQDKFVILWSLSGSSYHKVYHKAEEVAKRFLDNHRLEAKIITVGDNLCRLLEWDHTDTKKRSGLWSVRKSLVMAKYAHLVVGTETGLLVAAGTMSTPKIILMSHASEENLTKYWQNCIPLHSNAACHPCHKLHYSLDTCPLVQISDDAKMTFNNGDTKFDTREEYPACMALLQPDALYEAIENFYMKWRNAWQSRQPQLQLQ